MRRGGGRSWNGDRRSAAAKPEPEPLSIVLEPQAGPVIRVEPLSPKSDAERAEDLQKEIGDIAAEQRRLTDQIKAMVDRDRRSRDDLKRTRKK